MLATRSTRILRFSLSASRSLSTTTTTPPSNPRFVPPASLGSISDESLNEDVNDKGDSRWPSSGRDLPPPPSPAFYTTRPVYYDSLVQLQTALSFARRALRAQHLLPLPPFALRALPPAQPAWANKSEMGLILEAPLTARMYKRVVSVLKELEQCNRIARISGVSDLEGALNDIMSGFESRKGIQARHTRIRAREVKDKGPLDEYGRSYTVGRRKTSAARVWMIEVQKPKDSVTEPIAKSTSILASPTANIPPPPTSAVLINSVPISTYFPLPADRERVLRPLKLTGQLGAFNVFALVRGGGVSGQSGAIALAVAKGCVAHIPELEPILKKGEAITTQSVVTTNRFYFIAKLLRRDPRMVERKKTGLAKARKRVGLYYLAFAWFTQSCTQYAWVKR